MGPLYASVARKNQLGESPSNSCQTVSVDTCGQYRATPALSDMSPLRVVLTIPLSYLLWRRQPSMYPAPWTLQPYALPKPTMSRLPSALHVVFFSLRKSTNPESFSSNCQITTALCCLALKQASQMNRTESQVDKKTSTITESLEKPKAWWWLLWKDECLKCVGLVPSLNSYSSLLFFTQAANPRMQCSSTWIRCVYMTKVQIWRKEAHISPRPLEAASQQQRATLFKIVCSCFPTPHSTTHRWAGLWRTSSMPRQAFLLWCSSIFVGNLVF